MAESTAIVNPELVLRPKDINEILKEYRLKLYNDRVEIEDELVDILSRLIKTIPKYKAITDIKYTTFSSEFYPRSTSLPTVILTPYMIRMREETIKIPYIYSLERKEYFWGERYEVDPRVLRELERKGILEGTFNNLALYEFFPTRSKQIPIEFTWIGETMEDFEKYQENARKLFEEGDGKLYSELTNLMKSYWKQMILIPVKSLWAEYQLVTLTERELSAENPLLYSFTAEFKLTEKYSNYEKVTGKKKSHSSKNIGKTEIEAEIIRLKKEIELIDP